MENEKESARLDSKTVGFFPPKSVKKSAKRGVRVLRARSVRASYVLFDCSRVLEYAKIRTVLQSRARLVLLFLLGCPARAFAKERVSGGK